MLGQSAGALGRHWCAAGNALLALAFRGCVIDKPSSPPASHKGVRLCVSQRSAQRLGSDARGEGCRPRAVLLGVSGPDVFDLN